MSLLSTKSIKPTASYLIFFSISPNGFIIAAIPLFADLTTYFPFSIALNILCVKCCLGPIDFPNQPSSEIFKIKSKSKFSVKFPLKIISKQISGKKLNLSKSFLISIISLDLPFVKDAILFVIILILNLLKKFSKGINSPKGTKFILL